MFADAQRVATAAIASGGVGYKVNDVFAPAGGTLLWCSTTWGKSSVCLLKATAVDGSGSVTAVSFLSYGGYTIAPTGTANAAVGGSGSGLTLTLTFTLYWRNEDWVTLEGSSLLQVISIQNLQSADENIDDTAVDQDPATDLDSAREKRSDACVANAINDVRGAIKAGGRYPLSLTENAVPPSSTSHVLNSAAYMLVAAKPDLAAKLLLDPAGGEAPIVRYYQEAREWIKRVKMGESVEYPSDPDPSWQPAVRFGFLNPPQDLTTYGYAMPLTCVPLSLGAL